MRQQKNPIIHQDISIIDLDSEGRGIARMGSMVVFVPGAVPGDIADMTITRRKRHYAEGAIISLKKESPHRINPVCHHFGLCGGCKIQNINYAEQLRIKEKMVRDSLTRLGKIKEPNIRPVIPSKEVYFYRNKLEYSFSNKRWINKEEKDSGQIIHERRALGFHIPGRFDKIIDISECLLQPEPSGRIRTFIKEYALQHNLEFYDIRSAKGFLRSLFIRTNLAGECMVNLVFAANNEASISELMHAISSEFSEVSSLYYMINDKRNDSIYDLEPVLIKGTPWLKEKCGNIELLIGPKSFFQTNSAQAKILYDVVREYACRGNRRFLLDLYCGTGSIGLYLAGDFKEIFGIETVPESVAEANLNKEHNRISNIIFANAMVEAMQPSELVPEGLKADVVVIDPPRPGVHPKVISSILELKAEKLVYVSCNPATQARDISMLSEKYRMAECTPVDMFPQTTHVENVALLELTE